VTRHPPTTDARCGTYAGAMAHPRRGEDKCEPCLKAARDYVKNRRQRAEVRRAEYEQKTARTRALARLARLHPTEFRDLLAEESATREPGDVTA
jgi:hypothetical protein